jgi:hypothetical protein
VRTPARTASDESLLGAPFQERRRLAQLLKQTSANEAMAMRQDRSGDEGNARRGWFAWLRRRVWPGGGNAEAQTSSSPVRQASMERGHEPENASESIGGIMGATALLVIAVAVVVWAISAFVGFLGERDAAAPLAEAEITRSNASRYHAPPKPRLQIDPATDLQALHEREHDRLHTYGRVDSSRFHIPIDRAMRLVNQRGLPADSAGSDSVGADAIRVPTESGFRVVSRRFPGPPRSEPFLGSSPEPYTPAPAFARRLTEDGYLPRARADSARR